MNHIAAAMRVVNTSEVGEGERDNSAYCFHQVATERQVRHERNRGNPPAVESSPEHGVWCTIAHLYFRLPNSVLVTRKVPQ